MNNNPVLFIDSGIGGIPYCRDFLKKNPWETVCYIADQKNFPYGPREKDELISILTSLTEKLLKKLEPKIIVIACNTATVAALPSLRQAFAQIPFVGTVPAIKPAAEASNTKRIGVLGTERTIEEIRSLNLAEKNCEITGIAAPDLVDFIELHFDTAGENEKKEIVQKYIDILRGAGADTLVLGCTHFLFLLEEFRSFGSPYLEVFDSLDGISKRIEFLLDRDDCLLRAKTGTPPVHRLMLTGLNEADFLWEKRARSIGFELVMLNDL